jgi:hypothetical protein
MIMPIIMLPRDRSGAAASTFARGARRPRIRGLVAAWLLGFGSEHTRRNYASDIAGWLKFCGTYWGLSSNRTASGVSEPC